MPSTSKKQAKLMRAVAHGWKPTRIKGPTRKVAREFVAADQARDRYALGGFVGPLAQAAQRGGKRPEPQRMMGPRPNVRPGGALSQAGGTGMAGNVPNGLLNTARGAMGRGRDPRNRTLLERLRSGVGGPLRFFGG